MNALILFGIIALACMVRSYHNAAKVQQAEIMAALDGIAARLDAKGAAFH